MVWYVVWSLCMIVRLMHLLNRSCANCASPTCQKMVHACFWSCVCPSCMLIHSNRSLLSSGGLMADVPCLDHSLDGCKGRPDDVQTTKHAHAWSRCARTSLGAHASLFGASGARFWIVTRATSARIEEPSMVSILYIKSSVPDTYK